MEGQTVRRATGREVLAEVYSNEAERRLELHEKHPGSHVAVITGKDGQQQTYTPVPGDRKFELDHLLRLAWESSEDRATRQAVDGAATEQHRRLVADVQKTREYGAAARELAAAGRMELTALGMAEKEVWRVELSDKQAIGLRVYAERQCDLASRDYYAGLARGERRAYSDREREAVDRGPRDRTQGIDL